jgi:hypothetical protein
MNKGFKCIIFMGFLLCLSINSFAQAGKDTVLSAMIEDVVIRVDTLSFSLKKDKIKHGGETHLPFLYQQDEQIIEVRLIPKKTVFFQFAELQIVPSSDFDLLDSIAFIDNAYLKFRLRFKSISKTDLLSIVFKISSNEKAQHFEVKLFPYSNTSATFYPGNDELFIGEEKRFEIITNNVSNLRLTGEWKYQGSLEYRLIERNGQAFIDIISNGLGAKSLDFAFETNKPYLDSNRQVRYALDKQTFHFNVRGSRLSFLKIDKREIIKSKDAREGMEIQLDHNRFLQINKTYRIEDREEKGGPLVAELYTLRRLSNDKVLCIIRPYLYHQISDGYLFIKDGDDAQFITNVNILPEAQISGIRILREGKEWSSERIVKPGETLEIRITGEGLNQARLLFEDLDEVFEDTIAHNDKLKTYKVKIPVNIRKKQIDIYNYDKNTGYSLYVHEYERPRPLDFVMVNYGKGAQAANKFNQLVLYKNTIKDIVLSFDVGKIDRGDYLYGKQILEIEIRVTGARDELIEMQKIDYVEVCPNETSPRSAFYESKTCQHQELRINNYLTRKTHNLDAWSRIEILIRHKKDRYGGEGYTQRIVIVLQQLVAFDVEVSFPAGLMIKRVGVDGFPGLSGISLAMISQFSFYDRDKVRRLKPYKIGAGFLAQNAFNFNPDVKDRDLGIVILGSVYPTRKETKLSFPLYGGFGYFLNEDKFFYLLGPGIRVNF